MRLETRRCHSRVSRNCAARARGKRRATLNVTGERLKHLYAIIYVAPPLFFPPLCFSLQHYTMFFEIEIPRSCRGGLIDKGATIDVFRPGSTPARMHHACTYARGLKIAVTHPPSRELPQHGNAMFILFAITSVRNEVVNFVFSENNAFWFRGARENGIGRRVNRGNSSRVFAEAT